MDTKRSTERTTRSMRFYCLNMIEDVELFCRECMECGARKNPHEYGKAPLKQIETTMENNGYGCVRSTTNE